MLLGADEQGAGLGLATAISDGATGTGRGVDGLLQIAGGAVPVVFTHQQIAHEEVGVDVVGRHGQTALEVVAGALAVAETDRGARGLGVERTETAIDRAAQRARQSVEQLADVQAARGVLDQPIDLLQFGAPGHGIQLGDGGLVRLLPAGDR